LSPNALVGYNGCAALDRGKPAASTPNIGADSIDTPHKRPITGGPGRFRPARPRLHDRDIGRFAASGVEIRSVIKPLRDASKRS